MSTEVSPPPIPKPAKRRRPLERVFVLAGVVGIVAIVWTMRGGPSAIGFRDRTDVAEAGVTNVVAALVTVTEDARVANLRECFRDPRSLDKDTFLETIDYHTDIAYQLLQMGSRAPLDLRPVARAGLYQGYIDLGHDPWGQRFYIYFGPMVEESVKAPSEGMWDFEKSANDSENAPAPKSATAVEPPPFVAWPGAHTAGVNAKAVPAPAGLPFYVICAGPNGVLDQPFNNGGTIPADGDDITSWDGYAWEVVRGNRE